MGTAADGRVEVEYTSEWSGELVVTKAMLDMATGVVSDIEAVDAEPITGPLRREYVTLPEGGEVDVHEEDGRYVVDLDALAAAAAPGPGR